MDLDSLLERPTLVLILHLVFGAGWLAYAVFLGIANDSLIPVVLNGAVAVGIVVVGVLLRRRFLREAERA